MLGRFYHGIFLSPVGGTPPDYLTNRHSLQRQ
jgi:hypothetical protein